VLDHTGTGAPAVLADVLVTRAPDPAFEVDRRVLVKRGQLGPLGLGHQQPLGIIERRQEGCIHRVPRSLKAPGRYPFTLRAFCCWNSSSVRMPLDREEVDRVRS
jgi:hypothetical protein